MDAIQAVYDVLIAAPEIQNVPGAALSASVYGGALPEHFDPTTNPACVIHVRGGTTHSEMPLIEASVGVTSWAGINQFKMARQVYGAVRDTLHGLCGQATTEGRIVSCVEEVPGQDVTDPETGWATVVSFYKLILVDA